MECDCGYLETSQRLTYELRFKLSPDQKASAGVKTRKIRLELTCGNQRGSTGRGGGGGGRRGGRRVLLGPRTTGPRRQRPGLSVRSVPRVQRGRRGGQRAGETYNEEEPSFCEQPLNTNLQCAQLRAESASETRLLSHQDPHHCREFDLVVWCRHKDQ